MNTVIVPRARYFDEACEALRFFGKDVKWIAKGSFSSIGHRFVVEDLFGNFYSIFWFNADTIGSPEWKVGQTPTNVNIQPIRGLRELGCNLDTDIVSKPGVTRFDDWE